MHYAHTINLNTFVARSAENESKLAQQDELNSKQKLSAPRPKLAYSLPYFCSILFVFFASMQVALLPVSDESLASFASFSLSIKDDTNEL